MCWIHTLLLLLLLVHFQSSSSCEIEGLAETETISYTPVFIFGVGDSFTTTRNPFLGRKLLGISIRRGLGAREGLKREILAENTWYIMFPTILSIIEPTPTIIAPTVLDFYFEINGIVSGKKSLGMIIDYFV